MFANFFFSGSSAASQPPVADFTGTPTSGTFPLSVTFTDSSTGTPTAWHYEKNDGSGWVDFDGTPTAQNPTEVFAEGTWSTRETATNSGGSNTKTRINYISANPPASNLDELGNYLFLVRPRDDAAAGRLWQNLAKTTPANTSGQNVLVASAAVSPLSPPPVSTVDLAENNSTARVKLGTDGSGITYLESIGDENDGSLTNATVLSPIGTGSYHAFEWAYLPVGATDYGAFVSYFSVATRIWSTGAATLNYNGVDVNLPNGTIAANQWQCVQYIHDATGTRIGLRANDGAITYASVSSFDTPDSYILFGYLATVGVRIGSFGIRNVLPTSDDLNTVWLAGPNGDGIDWPPDLAVTATVLYSGEIVSCLFGANFTLGTGDPIVTIDGTDVTCTRVYQIATNELWIRIPPASILTDSSTVVTLTLPDGLVSLGHTTNHAVTNNTNVETLLPTTPPINASDIEVGNNYGAAVYFTEQSAFSNATKFLSDPETFGGTVTYGTNGLPLTITGGTGYVRSVMFLDLTNPWQTGNYLLRTKGAGTATLFYNFGTPGTVSHTGTAGGWNVQVVNIPSYNNLGLAVQLSAPLTDFEMIFPGDWDVGTYLPLTVVDANWSAMYSQHSYMRNMSWFPINDSLLRYITDYFPDGYCHGLMNIRTANGTIIAATATTSLYIGLTSSCWLITHAIPGDPFRTGDVVNTGGTEWLVERVNSTQYKALGGASAPTGSISFAVGTTGIIEDMGRAASELNQGIWFNIPHPLDDAGVTAVATRLLAVTTPGIKVRLELSNEVWNFGFKQRFYFDGFARVNGTTIAVEYSKRAADVHKLFLDAFTTAGRASDLIRLVAWQAFDSSAGKDVMDGYKARCVSQGYSFTAPHEYAVTNYFSKSNPTGGSDPASTRFRDFICNGSNTPLSLTAAALIDLAVFALLDGTSNDGTLTAATNSANMVTTWNAANTAAVRCVTYEGSQSLDGAEFSFSGKTSGDGPNYAGTSGLDGAGAMMNAAFSRANRHPRMAHAQLGSIKQCLDLGYAAWSQFGSLAMWGRYGYWSDTEYFNQPVGAGTSNLADLDLPGEAVKLYAEQQWIAG